MRFTAVTIAFAILSAVGCKGEPPPGPKTADYGAQREALMTRLDKTKKKKAAAQAPVVAQVAPADEVAGLGIMAGDFSYDPAGRRDPFRSFEWERPDRIDDTAVRGPLEQFDVSQLDVVAVVWNTDSARALIQDPAGQSYIIGAGARIGKNSGRVIQIDDNLIVVKETYVDFLGQETTKDIELRIRGSEGGEFHAGIQ